MSVNKLAFSGQNYQQFSSTGQSRWLSFRDERYLEYRRLWAERAAIGEPGEFPLHLDIETTNHCNLKCTMCPRTRYLAAGDWSWSPQGLGRMDFALYSRLIEQAAAGGAYSVKLNLLGEPLLHPDLLRQVALASGRGLYVQLNTNAMLLTSEISRNLLEAGLDDIFFSLDSPYREKFENIRVGACFETVVNNIAEFVRLKNEVGRHHVQTRAAMVTDVSGPTSEEEKDDFSRLMRRLGIEETGYGPADDHLADHSLENADHDGRFSCDQLYQSVCSSPGMDQSFPAAGTSSGNTSSARLKTCPWPRPGQAPNTAISGRPTRPAAFKPWPSAAAARSRIWKDWVASERTGRFDHD